MYDLYTKLKGENFNLFNYIDTIWKDVNTACGNTHNFELLTELERPNVVKIADMTFQAEALPPEKLFEFKIPFLFNNNNANSSCFLALKFFLSFKQLI